MRGLILALFLALPGVAWGACPSVATDCPSPTMNKITVGGLATLTGGGTLGGNWGGTLNLTNSLKQGGSVVFNGLAGLGNGASIAIGVGAGANLPNTDQESTLAGFHAGNAQTNATAEITMYGWEAGANETAAGSHNSGFGTATQWHETTGLHLSSFGGDDMRNSMQLVDSSTFGAENARNCFNVTSVYALGFQAVQCNFASLAFGGTGTSGDTVNIIFTPNAGSPLGSTQTVSVSATAGETPAQIASAIYNAINANATLASATIGALYDANADPTVVAIDAPGNASVGTAVSVTSNITGSATETVTIANGVSGSNTLIGIGAQAVQGYGLSTGNELGGFGNLTLASARTLTTTWAIGDSAGKSLQSGSLNVLLGQKANEIATSLTRWTVVGGQDGTYDACQSSGSADGILIGSDLCPASTSDNGQMNIGGLIFGYTGSPHGTSIGAGYIGIGIYPGSSGAAHGARLTVKGTGTGSEYGLQVENSAGTPELIVRDDGHVGIGGAPNASYTAEIVGSINADSGYSVAGTAGVSCGAGTVLLSTLVVTNGIVTHC